MDYNKPLTPTDATQYDAFLSEVADGQSVRDACAAIQRPWSTVRKWIAATDDTIRAYAGARSSSAHVWADRAWDCAQSATKDTAPAERVRAEVARWRAGVSAPREYGDRQTVETSGTTEVTVRVVRDSLPLPSLLLPPPGDTQLL